MNLAYNTNDYNVHMNQELSIQENPDIHQVSGHYRKYKSGKTVWVDSHLRTNRDGTSLNNLSNKK